MNPIEKLTEYFSKFPGIGPRQGERFVYFLLRQDASFAKQLAETISEVKEHTKICKESYAYFYTTDPKEILSPIARDKNRDQALLMVVEKDNDLENIERSRCYKGHYFVLGGILPFLEKEPDSKIRSKELLHSVEKRSKEGLEEIILALSANPDGEHTTSYIKELLLPFAKDNNLKISILGRGLSTGAELEYSDSGTIKNALVGRT